MPIYEYKCVECEELHEFLQKFSDPPKTKCPSCGGKLHKLISMNSFHLKGGGWYADGYTSKSPSVPKDNTNDTAKPDTQKTKTQPVTSSANTAASV